MTTPLIVDAAAQQEGRIQQLEAALLRVEEFSRGAMKKLARQLRRHNAGEVATVWDAEDIARVLSHIAATAEAALLDPLSQAAPPVKEGGGG